MSKKEEIYKEKIKQALNSTFKVISESLINNSNNKKSLDIQNDRFFPDSLKVKALNNLYGDIFPYFPIENLDKSIDEIKTMTIKMIKNNSTKKKITNINHSMKKYFDIEKL